MVLERNIFHRTGEIVNTVFFISTQDSIRRTDIALTTILTLKDS